MERVIKFRAWSERGGMRNIDVLAIGECRWACPDYGKNGVSLAYQPSIKVMQFTGLKDKNGVEIYEGDIVKHLARNPNWDGLDDDSPIEIETTSTVEYMGHGFWLSNESFGWEGEDLVDWENLEVIGNIHQSPHLLK